MKHLICSFHSGLLPLQIKSDNLAPHTYSLSKFELLYSNPNTTTTDWKRRCFHQSARQARDAEIQKNMILLLEILMSDMYFSCNWANSTISQCIGISCIILTLVRTFTCVSLDIAVKIIPSAHSKLPFGLPPGR